MIEIQEAMSFIQLIEEGVLINPDQIEEHYNIKEEDLEMLVSNRELSYPIKRFGTEWYLEKEIELVIRFWKREG